MIISNIANRFYGYFKPLLPQIAAAAGLGLSAAALYELFRRVTVRGQQISSGQPPITPPPSPARNATQHVEAPVGPNQESDIRTELKKWCEEVRGTLEFETREWASQQILECYLGESKALVLRHMDLNRMGLSSLPRCIGECSNLEYLVLDWNRITSLPESLGKCSKLQQLHVVQNQLTSLPKSLSNCLQLRVIDIEGNRIDSLPNLRNLRDLRQINISDNPLPRPLPTGLTNLIGRVEIIDKVSLLSVAKALIPAPNICKKLGFRTPPNIARASHDSAPAFGPRISKLLNNLGATSKDVDINLRDINPSELEQEVHQGLEEIKTKRISIPAQLLQNATASSLIGKIKDFAMQIMSNCQGLALPGGPDVEPEFYRPPEELLSCQDYRRSITEFALISTAHQLKKPVIGTCRGGQMLNVYFGGTLKDVQGQLGFQSVRLSESTRKEELKTLLERDPVSAYANHHQACDKIAPGFEVVMHVDNIPKVIISEDGLMIGTQVHPELAVREKYLKIVHIYELFFRSMLPKKPEPIRSSL